MEGLPVLAAGFLFGLAGFGVTFYVARKLPARPLLIKLALVAGLGGYCLAMVLEGIVTTGIAVLGGLSVAALFYLALTRFSEWPARAWVGVLLLVLFSALAGYDLARIELSAYGPSRLDLWSRLVEAGQRLGNFAASGQLAMDLFLPAAALVVLVWLLRRRIGRRDQTSERPLDRQTLWLAVLAGAIGGALVHRIVSNRRLPSVSDLDVYVVLGTVAALLFVCFLISLWRGDRPGIDTYAGGLAGGFGGWRITPALAFLLGSLALGGIALAGWAG